MNKLLSFITLLISSVHPIFPQTHLSAKYDVKEYILDLNISSASTEISGNVITHAVVVASALDTFAVELINTIVLNQTYMIVDSVFVNGIINEFIHENHLVLIPLQQPVPQNQSFSVQIYYHGNGAARGQTESRGINRRTYMDISHTYTDSEPKWAKVWWPCKQDLTDKADSLTFYITTEAENKSGSNGLLKSTEYLPEGKVKYKWETKYPITYYLVSFFVGGLSEYITYVQLPNQQDSMLIQSLLFPSSPYYSFHLNVINKTKELLCMFSDIIGIYPYKDEKYGYCVTGLYYDGMENQTMSTCGYETMDTTAILWSLPGLNFSFYQWTTAHELVHHWFGGYVTLERWNDCWLKEGMASYFEYVALQRMESQAKADLWMDYAHTWIKTEAGGSVYIPDSIPLNTARVFDGRLSYRKGAAITHTLRYEVNDDDFFFHIIRNYLAKYAHSVANTENFKEVIETITGKDFTDFFNQWVYGEGYPIFNINWVQQKDTLFIESVQTTSTTVTPLFKTHFDLKLNYSNGGDTIVRLFQGANTETYQIFSPKKVNSIIFDPNIWLIHNNSVNCLKINEIDNVPPWRVFPNPAQDKININVKEEDLQDFVATLYDIQGRVILQKAINQCETILDIRNLQTGFYILELRNNYHVKMEKVIKE
jgi:aminopeptidase N